MASAEASSCTFKSAHWFGRLRDTALGCQPPGWPYRSSIITTPDSRNDSEKMKVGLYGVLLWKVGLYGVTPCKGPWTSKESLHPKSLELAIITAEHFCSWFTWHSSLHLSHWNLALSTGQEKQGQLNCLMRPMMAEEEGSHPPNYLPKSGALGYLAQTAVRCSPSGTRSRHASAGLGCRSKIERSSRMSSQGEETISESPRQSKAVTRNLLARLSEKTDFYPS